MIYHALSTILRFLSALSALSTSWSLLPGQVIQSIDRINTQASHNNPSCPTVTQPSWHLVSSGAQALLGKERPGPLVTYRQRERSETPKGQNDTPREDPWLSNSRAQQEGSGYQRLQCCQQNPKKHTIPKPATS